MPRKKKRKPRSGNPHGRPPAPWLALEGVQGAIVSLSDLAAITGKSKPTIISAMKRIGCKGVIRKFDDGRYRIFYATRVIREQYEKARKIYQHYADN